MTYAKPWEKGPKGKKKPNPVVDGAKKAAARKPWNPTPEDVPQEVLDDYTERSRANGSQVRLTEERAMILAKAMHTNGGNMVMALYETGIYPPDTPIERVQGQAWKWSVHPLYKAAWNAVAFHFSESDILNRDRVLAGLYQEAADRSALTSGSSRVAAWGKLASLLGMEAEKKPTAAEEAAARLPQGGVMLIPYSPDIEEWEAMAMGQQKQLKADVRT